MELASCEDGQFCRYECVEVMRSARVMRNCTDYLLAMNYQSRIVGLPKLVAISRSTDKALGNSVSSLMSSSKTASTHRKLASWCGSIRSPSYRDQHRRDSGYAANKAPVSSVAIAGAVAHDFRTVAGHFVTPLMPGRFRLRIVRGFCSRATGEAVGDCKRLRCT